MSLLETLSLVRAKMLPMPIVVPEGLFEACMQVAEISRHELKVPELWREEARQMGIEDYTLMTGAQVELRSSRGVWPRMILDEGGRGNEKRVARISPIVPRGRVVTARRYAFELCWVYFLIMSARSRNGRGLVRIEVLDKQTNSSGLARTQKTVGLSAAVCLREQIQGMIEAAREAGDQEFVDRVGSWSKYEQI